MKNILEERRMEVSENSWETLASQLDANDQKKKRTRFYPYAACIALLVSFIVFMILKTETTVGTETIVKTEIKSNNTIPKVDQKQETIPTVTEKIITKNNEIAAQESTPKVIEYKVVKDQLHSKQKEQLETELHKEVQNAVVIVKREIHPKGIETFIAQKEVVVDSNAALKASIAALSASEKVTITDEEIDQLLKEAQQSLKKLDVQKDVDITAFATADELLEEVELELDKSFKRKVYELIKNNIQKNRTVIADRD
ncbi:hypothetical protein H2O64_01420 [Kordia sp. YSTF-M3]|uniref:Anti-sigma factor n=1 Tax=Kordia aestuariivivens TaxID=2759037 RepID=A0ABR7Q427_9FLAO|nr:hypothetical protein [Kordia aestuariivivens]MBC8753310.1 hypothetical protein [Kordia aestuariivivens]